MDTKLILRFTLLILIILAIFPYIAESTTLDVDPSIIINSSLTTGSIFTININVTDVTNLMSYDFKLGFNNSILNAEDIIKGPVLVPENCDIARDTDNSQGYIWVSCYSADFTTFDGDGILETINFSVIGVGEGNLDLYDTELYDDFGGGIGHTTNDGYFSNIPTAICTRSNPNVTLSPETQNGTANSTFSYTVTVRNNDNNYCNLSTFDLTLSDALPMGWSQSLNQYSVDVSPQQNDSSTILTVTSPASASPGDYTVYVKATNDSYTDIGSANVTIELIPGNKTTTTVGSNPSVVDRYQNTTLWCDYRNATSNTIILGADVKFELKGEGINYSASFNSTSNLYEYVYNATNSLFIPWVRCTASAPGYESGFSSTNLGICHRANPSVDIIPRFQSGTQMSVLNYTVNVTNNDPSSLCGRSIFNLSIDGLPSGWTYSFDPVYLDIDWRLADSPRISFNSSNLTTTSSSTSASGNYTINVTVTNFNNTHYKNTSSLIYNVTGELITITETLTDKNNNPVQANISIDSVENSTDSQGRYGFRIYPRIYDILFNIPNLFIPDFWLKLASVNISSIDYNKLLQITNYTSENKISLIFNITDNQTIQTNFTNVPIDITKNGTALQKYDYLENLTDNFGWYYNQTKKILHIKFNETII